MAKGTIIDFMQLAIENEALRADLTALAAKHEFEFTTDELGDEELDDVSGGVVLPKHPGTLPKIHGGTGGQKFNLGALGTLSKLLGVESTTFPNPVKN